MTDVVALAQKLYRRINQQTMPEPVGWVDLVHMIEDAIEDLYVISGRSLQYSEEMFEMDDSGNVCKFANDLALDERKWVIKKAEIEFYKWVQASVDDQTSYTTDAISLTHGDKPYEHIGETIDKLKHELDRIWYTMTRYNQLGVAE